MIARGGSEKHFPGHEFTVLNRGVNGEEITDMLARLESSIHSVIITAPGLATTHCVRRIVTGQILAVAAGG